MKNENYIYVYNVSKHKFDVCTCECMTNVVIMPVPSRILSSLYRPNTNPQQYHCYNERY